MTPKSDSLSKGSPRAAASRVSPASGLSAMSGLPDGPVNPSFETGDLTGWTVVSGTAFANASVTDTSECAGGSFDHEGRYHLWGSAAGDEAVGELRSSSWIVPEPEMSFLVGGGWDAERL